MGEKRDDERPTDPQTPYARAGGLSLWLPSRVAQQLACLAKDAKKSLLDTLTDLIQRAFRERP